MDGALYTVSSPSANRPAVNVKEFPLFPKFFTNCMDILIGNWRGGTHAQSIISQLE
jgi:hypothetical protein